MESSFHSSVNTSVASSSSISENTATHLSLSASSAPLHLPTNSNSLSLSLSSSSDSQDLTTAHVQIISNFAKQLENECEKLTQSLSDLKISEVKVRESLIDKLNRAEESRKNFDFSIQCLQFLTLMLSQSRNQQNNTSRHNNQQQNYSSFSRQNEHQNNQISSNVPFALAPGSSSCFRRYIGIYRLYRHIYIYRLITLSYNPYGYCSCDIHFYDNPDNADNPARLTDLVLVII